MKQIDLVNKHVRMILKDSIIAVTSDTPLNTVSSAFHNGGFKKTRVIVNAQVPQDYNDHSLHQDPEAFIQNRFHELGLKGFGEDFVGMITFAVVDAYASATMRNGDIAVSVVATAGCTHAESAGEKIIPNHIPGTINLIVVIDGHPTENCLVSTIITATEAKTSALRELDVRSLYSGNEATGTPTDAIVVAETGNGKSIVYGGPISPLGQLVAQCTKKAVKEAVEKAPIGGYPQRRSVRKRLAERHLSVEKMAQELSKVQSLGADEKIIAAALESILDDDVSATALFAAAKLSEDLEWGFVPPTLTDVAELGKRYGRLLSQGSGNDPVTVSNSVGSDKIDLPPFLKQVLVQLVGKALRDGKTGNLK